MAIYEFTINNVPTKWMRSSRLVRASDSQYRSRNCPGFYPSIWIWGAADDSKTEKIPIKKEKRKNLNKSITQSCLQEAIQPAAAGAGPPGGGGRGPGPGSAAPAPPTHPLPRPSLPKAGPPRGSGPALRPLTRLWVRFHIQLSSHSARSVVCLLWSFSQVTNSYHHSVAVSA
jgi:hypothetical protein